MNLYVVIFIALAAVFLPAAWAIFKRNYNNVVDHFEEDEEIARRQGL